MTVQHTDPATEDRTAEPLGEHELKWMRERVAAWQDGDEPKPNDAEIFGARLLAELDRQKTAYAYAVKDLLYQHKTERDALADQVAKLGLELNSTKRERDEALSDLADERATRVEAEDAYGRVAMDAANRLSELEAAQARLDKVERFIDDRREVITALRNCPGSDDRAGDYMRWQGHAEARRVLADALGVELDKETGGIDLFGGKRALGLGEGADNA